MNAKMKNQNPLPGLVMVALSLFGMGYVVRFLSRALSNGFVPGKLGAIHSAGSVQFVAAIIGCAIGILLFVALTFMGLRFAGLIRLRAHDAD